MEHQSCGSPPSTLKPNAITRSHISHLLSQLVKLKPVQPHIAFEMRIENFPSSMLILMDSTQPSALGKANSQKRRSSAIDRSIRPSNLADWFTNVLPKSTICKTRDALMRCVKMLLVGVQDSR